LRVLIFTNVFLVSLLLRLFRFFGLCCLLAGLFQRLGRGNVLMVRGVYIAESSCGRASVQA
jgi:hypothetical protein